MRIQSGKDAYTLTLGDAVTQEIDRIKNGYTTFFGLWYHPPRSGVIRLTSVSNDDFRVDFDTSTNRIIVEDVRIDGGYVDITGKVMNTGNGQIRVLGAYGNVQITNNTAYDLEVNRVDLSNRGEGTLIIRDKARGTDAAPLVTIYRQTAAGLTVQSGSNAPTAVSAVSTYQPQAGSRYAWTVGQETATRTTTTYRTSSWLGIDDLAADPGTVYGTPVTEAITQPKLMDAGPYFYSDASNALPRYTYTVNPAKTYSDVESVTASWTTTTWYGTTTYYTTKVRETQQLNTYTHTIEADRPISIQFMGQDEGSVSIRSTQSNVRIGGAIINPTGTTSITSDTGTIAGVRGDAFVNGRRINLTANKGIGSTTSPLLVDVADIPFKYDTATVTGPVLLNTPAFDFESQEGTKTIFQFDTVRLSDGDPSSIGTRGRVYMYVAPTPLTGTSLDLSNTNYNSGASGSKWRLPSRTSSRSANRITVSSARPRP